MSAIAYLHSQGVVHRDLKAENLLVVDPTEDFPTVKLIDFGFATILRHNLTGSFLGTGGYLAPEIRQQRLYSESVRCVARCFGEMDAAGRSIYGLANTYPNENRWTSGRAACCSTCSSRAGCPSPPRWSS